MSVEFSAQKIQAWRSELPLSNAVACGKSLYEKLQQIYCATTSHQERFEALSLLRPTFSYICLCLQASYADSELIPKDKSEVAALVLALQFEMLNNYRLIIHDADKAFFINKKLLVSALQNAMLCCIKIIVQSYEYHRKPLPGTWLHFHRLFIIAQNNHVTFEFLSDNVIWPSNLTTLQDVYKYGLLLSIIDSNRLRHEDIVKLSYAVEIWAPWVELRKKQKKTDCLYVVDLLSDLPPKGIDFSSHHSEEYYYLDLEKISLHLQALLTAKKTQRRQIETRVFNEVETSLPIEYIENLIHISSAFVRRKQVRHPTKGSISVSLGLAHNQSPDGLKNRYRCDLVDQSETGYCLKWTDVPPVNLQCGELLTLFEKQNEVIATIGWMREDFDGALYIGLQFLDKTAQLAFLYFDSVPAHIEPVLVIPEDAQHLHPTRIIMREQPLKAGGEFTLAYSDKMHQIKFLRSQNISPLYREYSISFQP